MSRSYLARALWSLGFPEQALQHSQAACTLAEEVAHPLSLAQALVWAAIVHQCRREAPAAHAQAAAAMTLATEQGFAQWGARGTGLHGWALAMQGQSEAGLAEMRQGLAADLATGATTVPAVFPGPAGGGVWGRRTPRRGVDRAGRGAGRDGHHGGALLRG